MIYRDTGREHLRGGGRPRPTSWERCFRCPVEYSALSAMLKGKASSSYSPLAPGSKVGCSDFPAGTQARCHLQWGPVPCTLHPLLPREQCTGSRRAASSLTPQQRVPLQLLLSDKKHVGFLSQAAADPRGQGFPLEPQGQAAGRGRGLKPGAVRGQACRGEDGGAMPQARLQRTLGRHA